MRNILYVIYVKYSIIKFITLIFNVSFLRYLRDIHVCIRNCFNFLQIYK